MNSTDREGQIADAILRMRNPLACVELAASQLSREAASPAVRDLAWGISEAVAQLDEGIEDSLHALRGSPAGADELEDGREVLDSICERMAPVLRVHGIRWKPRAGADEATPVRIDRGVAKHAAIALLRAGIALAGSGGRIALGFLQVRPPRVQGLVLDVEHGSRAAASADDSLAAPRQLALRLGGSLEVGRDEESTRVVLRFAPVERT